MGVRNQTRSDVRRKHELERKLLQELQKLHRKIVRSFTVFWSKNSAEINITGIDDLQPILLRHYQRVGIVFKGDLDKRLADDVRKTKEESATARRTRTFHYTARSREQAQRILRTTQKNISESVKLAYKKDPIASADSVGPIAAAHLRRLLEYRARLIATFETQWSAETAKLIEATILLGGATKLEIKAANDEREIKIWDSLGDSRVRTGEFNHLSADGQARLPDAPFEVSGELLLFPGDTSLGASQGNVQRCRCGAYYDHIAVGKIRKGTVDRRDLSAEILPGQQRVEIADFFGPAGHEMFAPRLLPGDAPAVADLEGKIIEKQLRLERFEKNLAKELAKGTSDPAKVAQFEKRIGEIKRRTEKLVVRHPEDSFIIQGREFGAVKRVKPPPKPQKVMKAPKALKPKKTRPPKKGKKANKFDGHDKKLGALDDITVMPSAEATAAEWEAAKWEAAGLSNERALLDNALIRAAELGDRKAQEMASKRFIRAPNKEWKFNNFELDAQTAISAAKKEMLDEGLDLRKLSGDLKAGRANAFDLEDMRFKIRERLQALNYENDVKTTAIAGKISKGLPKTNLTSGADSTIKRVNKVMRESVDDGTLAGNLITEEHATINFGVKRGERAYASGGHGRANQIVLGEREDIGTIAHEFAHHIEFRNPLVEKRVNGWRNRRIAQAKKRGEVKTTIYKNTDEMGWEDGFYNHYVGKIYNHDSGEVLSMGYQTLFDAKSFAQLIKKDPEHMELVWSIARGG